MVKIYLIIAVIIAVAAIFMYRRKKGSVDMPYGIQVFDENSRLIFDLSHSTSRFIGTDELTAAYPNAVSKTISVAKSSSSEKIFFYLQLVRGDLNFNVGFNGGNAIAIVDDVNNTIAFTVKWGTYKIYYGVYVP